MPFWDQEQTTAEAAAFYFVPGPEKIIPHGAIPKAQSLAPVSERQFRNFLGSRAPAGDNL